MRDLARWPSIAVALLLLCATAVALFEYPGAFRSLNNRAAHNARQSETDRQLEITEPLHISKAFVLASLRIVPRDSTYAVVTGVEAPGATPLTLSALPGYLENLLLPRVRAARPQWVLCYGCRASERPSSIAWRRGSLVIGRVSG